jgi:hypothetical protein
MQRKMLLFLGLGLLCIPAVSARADYLYTFTTQGGASFAFSEPSLITENELPLPITPFELYGITFTDATVMLQKGGTGVCFFFFSGDVGYDCYERVRIGLGDYAYTYGEFENAISIGTFLNDGWSDFGCRGQDCTTLGDPTKLELTSLTISGAPAVPEPSSMLLLGSGALGLGRVLRRKLRAQVPRPEA